MPGQWLKLLMRLNDHDVYLTGGEVFLFQGITDILEGLFRYTRIYTNAMLITDRLLGRVIPDRVMFRCSYHPSSGPIERFVESIKLLKSRGISYQIYMVDVPENDVLKFQIDYFRNKKYELGIDYDQRRHVCKKGKVGCNLSTIIVSPDGTPFHCVSHMLRNKNVGRNLIEMGDEIPRPSTVVCDEPQACAPCDLAAASQEER